MRGLRGVIIEVSMVVSDDFDGVLFDCERVLWTWMLVFRFHSQGEQRDVSYIQFLNQVSFSSKLTYCSNHCVLEGYIPWLTTR